MRFTSEAGTMCLPEGVVMLPILPRRIHSDTVLVLTPRAAPTLDGRRKLWLISLYAKRAEIRRNFPKAV